MQRFGHYVLHTLIGRYMPDEESLNIQVKNLSFHRWVLALWRQVRPAFILIILGSWLTLGLSCVGGFLL